MAPRLQLTATNGRIKTVAAPERRAAEQPGAFPDTNRAQSPVGAIKLSEHICQLDNLLVHTRSCSALCSCSPLDRIGSDAIGCCAETTAAAASPNGCSHLTTAVSSVVRARDRSRERVREIGRAINSASVAEHRGRLNGRERRTCPTLPRSPRERARRMRHGTARQPSERRCHLSESCSRWGQLFCSAPLCSASLCRAVPARCAVLFRKKMQLAAAADPSSLLYCSIGAAVAVLLCRVRRTARHNSRKNDYVRAERVEERKSARREMSSPSRYALAAAASGARVSPARSWPLGASVAGTVIYGATARGVFRAARHASRKYPAREPGRQSNQVHIGAPCFSRATRQELNYCARPK